jgi:hypothetical protein
MKTERFKTAALALAGLLAMTAPGKSELDLGASTSVTPYDRYMQPVRQVLEGTRDRKPSIAEVSDLMRTGRGFHYEYTQPYVAASPAVTAARGAGDCKDKSLWLAQQMDSRDVRFVVGRTHPYSTTLHAWLLWRSSGEYYILDCTNTSRPIPVSSLMPGEYTAKYSWSSEGEYRHTGAATHPDEVAGQPKTHFHDPYQLARQPKPRFGQQYQVALRQTSPFSERQRVAVQRAPHFRAHARVALRTSSSAGGRRPITGRRKPHFHDQYQLALRQASLSGNRHQPGSHRQPHFHDRYDLALREPASSGGRHHSSSRHKPYSREGHPIAVLPTRNYLAVVRQRRP